MLSSQFQLMVTLPWFSKCKMFRNGLCVVSLVLGMQSQPVHLCGDFISFFIFKIVIRKSLYSFKTHLLTYISLIRAQIIYYFPSQFFCYHPPTYGQPPLFPGQQKGKASIKQQVSFKIHFDVCGISEFHIKNDLPPPPLFVSPKVDGNGCHSDG